MLSELHIQNIAVIQKASVELLGGLNVFTGETGAGKTILLSAIDAVLGERASKDLIRAGEDRAVVTALFTDVSPAVLVKLAELGYSDEEGGLLISREITAAGKSSCKINGMPATVSILREAAAGLIQIHGQRDSAMLLAQDHHLRLIDAYGELAGDIADYRQVYDRLCSVREELADLEMDDAQKAQRIDMLTFQIEEIDAARLLDPEEEQQLQTQRKLIRNAEKVLDSLSAAYGALQGDGEQAGILSLMDVLSESAGKAAEYMPELEASVGRVEEMRCDLSELGGDIRGILDDFAFDPVELDAVEYRLDTIYKLKKKYGQSIPDILAYLDSARAELESMERSEERALALERELAGLEERAQKLAEALRRRRAQAAKRFLAGVEQELAFLDMPSVKLTVHHTPRSLSPTGADELEFYISTNVGEPPKPLSKVASGGEVARIMLAIKNVLAEKDDIGTLVFDEVDTGVSGRAARKIGQKLAQVARSRQVICVTHLAQVAAFGDNHLLINKEVDKGRTFTRISTLDTEARVAELARISSGDLITETALQNARELLENSRKQVLDKR